MNYTVYQYNDRDYYVNAGAVYVRPGAIANLGGNGASGSGTADVSLVSASVDTAVATADTSSMAYLDGGTIIVTNDLVVRNVARSLAEALNTNDSFNLGLIGMAWRSCMPTRTAITAPISKADQFARAACSWKRGILPTHGRKPPNLPREPMLPAFRWKQILRRPFPALMRPQCFPVTAISPQRDC